VPTVLLMQKTRHVNLWTLQCYARPSVEAVTRLPVDRCYTAWRDRRAATPRPWDIVSKAETTMRGRVAWCGTKSPQALGITRCALRRRGWHRPQGAARRGRGGPTAARSGPGRRGARRVGRRRPSGCRAGTPPTRCTLGPAGPGPPSRLLVERPEGVSPAVRPATKSRAYF